MENDSNSEGVAYKEACRKRSRHQILKGKESFLGNHTWLRREPSWQKDVGHSLPNQHTPSEITLGSQPESHSVSWGPQGWGAFERCPTVTCLPHGPWNKEEVAEGIFFCQQLGRLTSLLK